MELFIFKSNRSELAVVALFFALSTIIMTWPLVPKIDQVITNYVDSLELIWCISWQWYALIHQPFNFFDANIYWPFSNTLASGDHVLGLLPFAGPLLAVGINPIATHNIIVALGFWLSGIAMYYLVKHWTGNVAAALIAGFLFAFNPVHIQFIRLASLAHMEFLPLILLSLNLYISSNKWSYWFIFCIFFWWNFLMSFYLAYIGCMIVFIYTIVMLFSDRARILQPKLVFGGVCFLVLTACMVILVNMPYFDQVGAVNGLSRPLDMISVLSPTVPFDYLVRIPTQVNTGIIIPFLIIIIIFIYRRVDAISRNGLLAGIIICVSGFILSAGPFLKTYSGVSDIRLPFYYLYSYLPFFSIFKNCRLWMIMMMFGSIIICGYVIARLSNISLFNNKSHFRGGKYILLFIFLSVFSIDALSFKHPLLSVWKWDERPEYYRWLEKECPNEPRLELPLGKPFNVYLGFSAGNQRPLMNGRPSLEPKTYEEIEYWAKRLPDIKAINFFQVLGLKWLMVHNNVTKEFSNWKITDIQNPFPQGLNARISSRNDTETIFKLPFENNIYRITISEDDFTAYWMLWKRLKLYQALKHFGVGELVIKNDIDSSVEMVKGNNISNSQEAILLQSRIESFLKNAHQNKPEIPLVGYTRKDLDSRGLHYFYTIQNVDIYKLDDIHPVDTGLLKGFSSYNFNQNSKVIEITLHFTPSGFFHWKNPEPGKMANIFCTINDLEGNLVHKEHFQFFPSPVILQGDEDSLMWNIPYPNVQGVYKINCQSHRIMDFKTNWLKINNNSTD